MKTVYFIRHAKSSWADLGLSDHDRPLNKRGKHDAPHMASLIVEKGAIADLIISSSARRARSTARHFRKALGLEKDQMLLDRRLYHAGIETILTVIQELPAEFASVFVFGHNPGFTHIANLFSYRPIENVPTCGIVKVEADITSWLEFDPNHGRMTAFYYPKMFNRA